MSHTVLEILKLTEGYFKGKTLPSPRVDAEILLAHVLNCKRLDLYLQHDRPLKEDELDRFREATRRRGAGAPVQHITGEQDFYDITLQVSSKALIPRPETEILVEKVFETIAPEHDEAPRRVLDIGTGTGAIAISLANGWPRAELWAVDLSLDALEVARGNVDCNGLSDRIHVLQGDGFEPVADQTAAFDLIVSNPPYIPSAKIPELSSEVRDHEPRLALDGGADGLDVIRMIAAKAPTYLKPQGWLFFEIGHGQASAVSAILADSGRFEPALIFPDLSARERIAAARLRD